MDDHGMFVVLMRAGWIILGSGFKVADDELKKCINAALLKDRLEKVGYVMHTIDSRNNDGIFYIFYKEIKITDIPQLKNKDELTFDIDILKARQDLEDGCPSTVTCS